MQSTSINLRAVTEYIRSHLPGLDVYANYENRTYADLVICEGRPHSMGRRSGYIIIDKEPTKSGRLKVTFKLGKLSPEAKRAVIEAVKLARRA